MKTGRSLCVFLKCVRESPTTRLQTSSTGHLRWRSRRVFPSRSCPAEASCLEPPGRLRAAWSQGVTRRRSEFRGPDSLSRGSQKCRPRCDRLVAFRPRRFVLREGLVLGPDFERRLTAGARADYLPDAFSFPGGKGAWPFVLGLECQNMGWRHGVVDIRNTRTKTCGRAPTLRHCGSTIHCSQCTRSVSIP